ncbi:type VI secretion system ATPase TssH [Endozoicomonas sp. OPT23]|uniref:type VI secretion system ATPase TssH n=1 Tax=Endozoicomonas sp. OPT23 TaxID=2072845 RepID=UPI00129B7D02|nr:type VI secretion system ATPase TssH [Endozoicomonas sp. OPT23]MRI33748.1 type VI secretion system ATPase TssH [Endozoicomonas sp. OPT23]
MQQLDLKTLIDRLSPELRSALESAAALCVSRKHKAIEIDHWLLQLFREPGHEMQQLINSQGVNAQAIISDIENRLQRLGKGYEQTPSLAPDTVSLVQDTWLLTSVNFQKATMTPCDLILALLEKDSFNLLDTPTAVELKQLSREKLKAIAEGQESSAHPLPRGQSTGKSALDKYSNNMTEQARNMPCDIVGRDSEIRQIIDILCRRRQNNPILVGDAGVGKTAVVEGLAQKIIDGNVPENLKGVELHNLDLGLLQAGASIKGEFENRLKDVMNEVKQSPHPIILFIDEAHTLVGTGGAAGQNDAANLLKPALARGELKTLAATTWAEYKKFFEKDAALTRRFQPVKVAEPDETTAVQMTRMVARSLESHHGVRVHDNAVINAVKLSIRYLPERQLPDKAISLLDTACSRVSLSHNTTPAALEQLQEKDRFLTAEITELQRDQAIGTELSEQIEELLHQQQSNLKELEELQQHWQKEQALAKRVFELEHAIDQQLSKTDETVSQELSAKQSAELSDLQLQLAELQGEKPLVLARVDINAVAAVVAEWTGIPAGKMLRDDIQRLLNLEESLQQRVIGQNQAISEICKSIRIGRAGLSDPRRPTGVFLMCGPSGVGKTETGLAIADQLYGGEHNLTVINMTEFKEEHKVSMLLGAPAGYVGYGEGGVLTEAVRRSPYSVLLLDEMEKAHPGVHDIFYQIFDKGRISDSEGREVDFRQTIIIMTTNAADNTICEQVEQSLDVSGEIPEMKAIMPSVNDALLHYFKPAFIGRLSVVPYLPLADDDMEKICRLSMNRIRKNLKERYAASFTVDDDVVKQLVAWNQSPQTGARAIEQLINRNLMPQLAAECLALMARDEKVQSVHVSLENEKIVYHLNQPES